MHIIIIVQVNEYFTIKSIDLIKVYQCILFFFKNVKF